MAVRLRGAVILGCLTTVVAFSRIEPTGVGKLLGFSASSQCPADLFARTLPEFIPTLRAYAGGGYDQFQRNDLKKLGLVYVQGLVDFTWGNLERGDNVWKWGATDEGMNKLARKGLKMIAFIICPKSPGLPWDETIERDDPRFVAQYEELAYEITKRYQGHPAWSGIVAVWGGSADVWDHDYPLTDPEVVVPLINAAYDGIKRADPTTIVAGFNFATTAASKSDWELYHSRAFALSPKFDWYGAQTHGVPATWLLEAGGYGGVRGLVNVRRFLDAHGYADKPIWLNEGGFMFGEDLGGMPEQVHAEQTAETFIVSRTLDVDLQGWVFFEYFGKEHVGEDYGIMTALDQASPPRPRLSWTAYKTLNRTVRFFDYRFETQISGRPNQATPPYVLRFAHRTNSPSKLWVVFSPRPRQKGQEPVPQAVTISIAPATRATQITMLGSTSTILADAAGNITIQSTSAPVYVKAVLSSVW